jgi:hypothetical protein
LFLLRDKHYKKRQSVADDLSGLFDRPTPNVSTNQAAPSITLPQVNKPKPCSTGATLNSLGCVVRLLSFFSIP